MNGRGQDGDALYRKARRWSREDLRRFADRDRLRASSIPPKRDPGPSPEEWDDDHFDGELFEELDP